MAIKTEPKRPIEKRTTFSPEDLPRLNPETEQMAKYWQRKIKQRERDEAKALEPKKPGRPPSGKKRVTMLLDPAVIAKFKATGDGWQARMNDVLAQVKL